MDFIIKFRFRIQQGLSVRSLLDTNETVIVHLLLISLHTACASCISDEDLCPKGARIDQDHLHCYWMPESASNWHEAENICQRTQGGKLAMADKSSTLGFLNSSFQVEVPALVWLRNGISLNSQLGGSEKKKCSQMTLGLGQWRNGPCDQQLHFICSKQISVSLPSMDSYVIGVPLMSGVYTQSQIRVETTTVDLGQQRVEMIMFPGLWFSHGGRLVSLDLVSQPGQHLAMAKVQILRPFCSLSRHLVPPGCVSILNPFSCCSAEPLCNTTGACSSGQYWCHLLESCLPVTSPCSPYNSSSSGHAFPLPPRYPAVPPFYHTVADISLKIPPASELVHFRVTFQDKEIYVYPDDIVAVQHSRKAGEFLHCVRDSDSAWRQSYLSLPGPEWGGWVELGLSADTHGGRWVDGVVCDLLLINDDTMHLYGLSPVLSSTPSELSTDTTTSSTSLMKEQTPISGLQVVYPMLSHDKKIHLAVDFRTLIILRIHSGQNTVSTWSAPVSQTDIPFTSSCPLEMPEISRVCEKEAPETWFTSAYITLSKEGEQILNITASNTLYTQTLSVKLQAHTVVTGLSIKPQGFYRVLVDIPQVFTASVGTGSSVKYIWETEDAVQSPYIGQSYNVVFKKPAKYMVKVTAENPVSSQSIEVRLIADVMVPLKDLELVSIKEAIAVNISNIYTLRIKLDISIDLTIRWDFGDGSPCVIHSIPAPLEKADKALDQSATQFYLQDSTHHAYTKPGDYRIKIEAQNKYDHAEKAVSVKVQTPLTKLLVSSTPAVSNVNHTILFEVSSLPSSYGILYTWNFGDGSLEINVLQRKIMHAFKAAGIYNVSVCANNTLSRLLAWITVEVIETISGVHLNYNGPNELNVITEIRGTVSTGSNLRWTFDLGDGFIFKNLTTSSVSHIYKSIGNYTAHVTVSNILSSERQSISIEIYQLSIKGILPFDCIASGKQVNLQAIVTGNASLLTFHWNFGDGTPMSVKRGISAITHTFLDSGNYMTDVTVYSQAGSAHYQKNICVETLITDLSLHPAQSVVSVGERTCFDALVIPKGSSHFQFLWYNSSSSDSAVSGHSHHCFVFSKEGTHEIMVITHNHISKQTAKTSIFVQSPVSKFSIQHDSNSNVLSVNQTYQFWIEPVLNSNGITEWDFGDGSVSKEGQNYSHTFTSAGNFQITASVSNAVSQELVAIDVEVQVLISNLKIYTNQSIAEAGLETVITVTSNVMENVTFYWKVGLLSPSQLGASVYRYVFPKAGVYEVKVMAQNIVSKMEASVLIEVVERIQGVQITSQALKSMPYYPTKETITLTALVKQGSNLTYQWLTLQDGFNLMVDDGKHFQLFTNKSGDVSVKLTVTNVLSKVCSEISLRAVERISDAFISTPVSVIAKDKPVNISVNIKTGTDLLYTWYLDPACSPITSDAPFLYHVFNVSGYFNLRVSVANIFGTLNATQQITVQEPVSEIDFEVDGKSFPFFVMSNSLLQFHGTARKGNILSWEWTVARQQRHLTVLGNNQTLSCPFMDTGEHSVTLNVSNAISWQTVTHIIEVQDAIQGFSVWASQTVICENDPVTITPSVSQGSGVVFILEYLGRNLSLKANKDFTASFFSVGNHTIKAVAKNHVSILATNLTIQVVESIKGLHLIDCCSAALEASKPFSFKASVNNTSQVTYSWSFHLDGFNVLRDIGQKVIYSPCSNGFLSVMVEASTTFCSQSITVNASVQWPVKNITLVGSPNGTFIDLLTTFFVLTENGNDLTFQWDFGDSKGAVEVTKTNRADHKYHVKGKFVVQVIAFNNVSQVSTTMTVEVRELKCTQPQIFLVQEQTKILKSKTNYFEAKVDLKNCVSYKATYLWEIFHDPNCTAKKMILDSSVDTTTPLLSLPKNSLKVGDYCLKFTTRFQGTHLENHKTTGLSVLCSPLVPLIKGGTHRLWSSQSDLILDGSESYDPDSAVQEDNLLQFHWAFDLNITTESYTLTSTLNGQQLQWNSSTVILPKHVLEHGTIYHFTLTVHKAGRQPVSTKQSVKICEAHMLPVSVKCVSCNSQFSPYISNSQALALAGNCPLCTGIIEYKWTVETEQGEAVQLNEVTTLTGDSSPDLVIRPGFLRDGSEYSFSLNMSQAASGLWGSSSVVLTLSRPPRGGNCTLSPGDSVTLLQNMVSFNCSGWVDENSESAQIIYSLQVAQCEDPDPLCPIITLYRGTQSTFGTLVPLGRVRTGNRDSMITVLVQVENNMGVRTTALRRYLGVMLPVSEKTTKGWLKRKCESDLWALLQQGNPQGVISYSTALTSLLNQLEAIAEEEFEDRVQMRGNVTQALASLSVSSLQDAAQISSAMAHSMAVPNEVQCGKCHARVVETVEKMIKVIRQQTRQGDTTPIETGRNILNILSSFMSTVHKPQDFSGVHFSHKHNTTSDTAVRAWQQVGELMRSLMWSRMPSEEDLFLKASRITAVGKRGNRASDLLCTNSFAHCQFHIPPYLSSQLMKEGGEVLQILLFMDNEANSLILPTNPQISTTLAAMEFATPQGLSIPITNLTLDHAIKITLHKERTGDVSRVNITLPPKGTVNFTIRAAEMEPHTGLSIALNFSMIRGTGNISSGQVGIIIADPLSQQTLVQQLNISLSADIPSIEETVFLTSLLSGSAKDLHVTLSSSVSGAEVCVALCVFSSLCQFFSMEERKWSTEGVSVLGSSTPSTAHCLTQHLTLFGASLFVHPDAIILLPPVDGPVRNVVGGLVCGVLLLIHLLVGLITHKLHHLERLRLSCVPLCGQSGRYHYRVLVKTGWQRGAGTSSHVGISLHGLNKSGSRHLQRDGAFQRNALDDFQVETDANLGEIWKICIWHDNTGLDPAWYLQHVVVWDMQSDNVFFFMVDDWLSVENEKNSGMVQRVVLATCPGDLRQFRKILHAQLLFGLREHHLWVSLWECPAHSSFSRTQRVTCCALLLQLYLAAGAVWYGSVGTKTSSAPVSSMMLINGETILAGMTVAFIMYPFQSLLTFLFRMTKSKVAIELPLPPSPVLDTIEMDVHLSHTQLSCSSFLSMPRSPESSTHEGVSPFTEFLESPNPESDFWDTSNVKNKRSVDKWTSSDSIFGLPELMGPTRLLKRKRALLQLQLSSPTSDLTMFEPSSSPYMRKQLPSPSEPALSSTASSGLMTSDSGRYSPNETFLSDTQESSCGEWSDLSVDAPEYEGDLRKSPSSLSFCSVASTFLPSLPPDSISITSNTRIGVPRRGPGVMLPSWVLGALYLFVVVVMGTCLALVSLYGSTFSNSVVLMWLTSALSAFLTSTLILEPIAICVRALYLAVVVKPVDPEVEERLAQETVVRRTGEELGAKVRPLCGYSLLQAKEEARKVRMLRTLMRKCLVYMLFVLVVLIVNYEENIQEMNSRPLQSAVKHSLNSASTGKPNLTELSGWTEAWQWMAQSFVTHLHQNPSLPLIGLSRLQRVQSKIFCGEITKHAVKYDLPSVMFTAPFSHQYSGPLKESAQINSTVPLLLWPWSKVKSCVLSDTAEILLGNSSMSTSKILSELQTTHWATAETQAVLVEFTHYHRETGQFLPVSIQMENSQTGRIFTTISIQAFHIPASHSGLDLNIALTVLLLLFSLCFMSAELWVMVRERAQYLRQGWHVFQLLLTLLSLGASSLRLHFLSMSTAFLSAHHSQPNTFANFHRAALLAKTSSQLSALVLTMLVLQTVCTLRFVRRWVAFVLVLQQAVSEICGVALIFLILLLLFSHTGSMLFSSSVEGFRTIWQASQSVLSLLRGRMVLHRLCERHPVIGSLYCLSVLAVGLWVVARLCGSVLLYTYRIIRAEMYRPSMEPQDYEMVEFLIKRLKLWMGLSKTKEFRHRVKFEGMASPPSRLSQFSTVSATIVPSAPRPVSSTSSLASESSNLSDSQEPLQYLDRLLPSVDSLLAGFDRVNQLADDVLNVELQLQEACRRMTQNRKKRDEQRPQNAQEPSPTLKEPQAVRTLSSQIPPFPLRHRATHFESSILGPDSQLDSPPAVVLHQAQQKPHVADPEVGFLPKPRRRAWHSGCCYSAGSIQRSSKDQNLEDMLARPRSEDGERSKVSEVLPVKRRAWHSENSETEKD